MDLITISGPSGSGKTSVSNSIHELLLENEISHAVIDGDILDLCYPPQWKSKLSMKNLSAISKNYKEAGISKIVYVNSVAAMEEKEIKESIGSVVSSKRVILTADSGELERRIRERDPEGQVTEHIERSLRLKGRYETGENFSGNLMDTMNRSPRTLATMILQDVGWLSTCPPQGGEL